MSVRVLICLASLGLAACAGGVPAAAPVPAGAPAAAAAPRADNVRSETLAPGVVHRSLRDARGPWAVHVVEAELSACGVDLRTLKAGGRLVGRATTSALAAEGARRWQRPVLAAINADFFSFRPDGVPIGAQVSEGEILKGPAPRAVFGLTREERPFAEIVALEGELRATGGYRAPLGGVNTRPAPDALSLYTRFAGEATPADTGAVEVTVRRLGGGTLVGDSAWGVVTARDTLPAGVALAADVVVLAGRGRGARFLQGFAAPGDTLRWTASLAPAPGPIAELVGGHPRLLARSREVWAEGPGFNRAFAETRHPRTAVGWRADGTLLLVTVDGRQPGYSVGMSLAELTALFRDLGASDALNLDGGGSTAMVVRGRVVNRPSDKEGERPVANALLLLGPAPGACAGG